MSNEENGTKTLDYIGVNPEVTIHYEQSTYHFERKSEDGTEVPQQLAEILLKKIGDDGQPEFREHVNEQKTEKPSTGGGASVPVLITAKMREKLKGRGFSDEQINAMTPQEANEQLAKKVEQTKPE
jgi:hypothetical protein